MAIDKGSANASTAAGAKPAPRVRTRRKPAPAKSAHTGNDNALVEKTPEKSATTGSGEVRQLDVAEITGPGTQASAVAEAKPRTRRGTRGGKGRSASKAKPDDAGAASAAGAAPKPRQRGGRGAGAARSRSNETAEKGAPAGEATPPLPATETSDDVAANDNRLADRPSTIAIMETAPAGPLAASLLTTESLTAAARENELVETPAAPMMEAEIAPTDDSTRSKVTTNTAAPIAPPPPAEAERGGRRGRRRRGGRGRGRRTPDNGIDAPPEAATTMAPPRSTSGVESDRRAVTEFVEDDDEEAVVSQGAATREMIINVSAGDECRIAVLHEGRLEELFIERTATLSHVGNIYKGRVTNVEPSIQAVFVDFGLPKNGFLHISDVQPQYFPNHKGEPEDVGRKIPRHHRPPIQKCFRRGQEVIVQITKEGVGTKGPTLTTYLSIPGRFLVMMPGMSQVGVSRKIEDEDTRRKMRSMLAELSLPSGIGFILRTAGLDRSKRELQRDLNYLQRLWKTVVERVRQSPAPAELYRESDLVIRTIRDVYSAEFKRVVVDDADTADRVRDFLHVAMPRSKPQVELYTEREPLFHRFGIEAEIERINVRQVPLRCGGSLVIDTTEAMVTIDVNSGKFRSVDDAEESAFKINLEAAEEIARQLRLRDLGGLIVCDFIDMRLDRHNRAVERALRDALKKHKERARILRMSAFGLIEMTRQRQGPSINRNLFTDCPQCRGAGVVKLPDSVMLDVIRIIQLAAHHDHVRRVTVVVAPDVAYRLLNKKRAVFHQIESETGKTVVVRGDMSFTSDQVEFLCEDGRGQPVSLGPTLPASRS